MAKRKYLVTERQDVPRRSHADLLFPECITVLKREEDGCIVRATLSKSLRWEPGDRVEVEDLLIESKRH